MFSNLMPHLSQSERRESADRALQQLIRQLAPKADALFVREPLIDDRYPDTSDIDVMAFGQCEGLLPERIGISAFPLAPPVDVIWLSRNALADTECFARNGLLPHRLLTSRTLYDRDGSAGELRDVITEKMYHPDIHAGRVYGFLQLAFYAVREVGVTWDFPAMALFWLHMAHTACLAAASDAMRSYCPNIYTRPFDYFEEIEKNSTLALKQSFIDALRLRDDSANETNLLRRMHGTISFMFTEPEWPDSMREDTRYEYRYFLSAEELDWRICVAEEMAARGNAPAAVFYLRFWAYALARIPMVYQCAKEGGDVSYLRPERAMLPALKKCCPEILDDLTSILSSGITVKEVLDSLNMLYALRNEVIKFIVSRGIALPVIPEWKPFRPPP